MPEVKKTGASRRWKSSFTTRAAEVIMNMGRIERRWSSEHEVHHLRKYMHPQDYRRREDVRSNIKSIVRAPEGVQGLGRGGSPTSGLDYFSSGPQAISQTADPSTVDLSCHTTDTFCPCLVIHAVFQYPQKTQQAVLCMGTSHISTPVWGLSSVVWVWAKV